MTFSLSDYALAFGSLFFIFVVMISVKPLVISWLVLHSPKKNSAAKPDLPQKNSAASKPIVSSTKVKLDLQEISRHSTASDCWLLIDGKVYNVTSFIYQHPGGAGNIISYCGKNATFPYHYVGHSSYADSIRSKFLLGDYGSYLEAN